MSRELERLRAEIDALDGQVLALLARRFRLVADIAREKARLGRAIADPEREARLVQGFEQAGRELGLEARLCTELLAAILATSKRLQERVRGELPGPPPRTDRPREPDARRPE